jgi:hypothetical protein
MENTVGRNAESLGDSGGVFLFASRHRNRVGEEVNSWKMYGHVRRIVQTVNENGNQAWVKKPGSHFAVTAYCCGDMSPEKTTYVIQTPHQGCLYGDGPEENPIASNYCR